MDPSGRIRPVSARRNWLLFLTAGVFLGLTGGLYDTSLNNYLNDVFHVSASFRGQLEFPRELPGVWVVVITGLFAMLPEARLAAIVVGLWAAGLFGMALFVPDRSMLVVWMMTASIGMHVYMPLGQSLSVSVAGDEQVGSKLGKLAAANTAAIILGTLIIWLGMRYCKFSYVTIYLIAAAAAVLALICLVLIRTGRRHAGSKPRFVYKPRYSLFYVLNILFGARKQIFVTFAPWVIIKLYGQPAATIAILTMIASVLGIGFKPLVGRLIDVWGERRVLIGESCCLILVCLGYASGNSPLLPGRQIGLYLTYTCYILDQLLFAASMARTTYLNKIADDPGDLTPTLALGTSLDHVVSMLAPTLGGFIWVRYGYHYVFLGAAMIAAINLFAANRIRIPAKTDAASVN